MDRFLKFFKGDFLNSLFCRKGRIEDMQRRQNLFFRGAVHYNIIMWGQPNLEYFFSAFLNL